MKKKVYKALSLSNDLKAIKRGRAHKRLWNKGILKLARNFMK